MITLGICLVSAQSNGTGQTFLTGGGCNSIPGIGSPILMIANAHKFIEDALNIKNFSTNIKYIHFVSNTATSSPQATNIKIAFSLTDYTGTKYLGIDLNHSPFGIGSTRINKFLMTNDFNRVKQFIDTNAVVTNSISCGDLKFVYSSFGNDPTADLDYPFPGRNQNTAGLAILDQLNSNTAKPAKTKHCITAKFLESVDFFGTNSMTAPVDLLLCLPNKNAVAAIKAGCNANSLASLQLLFNNFSDDGVSESILVGNGAIASNLVTSIDLLGADRISITTTTTPLSVKIETLDKNNNILKTFTCGVGIMNPKNIVMSVADFLGITNIYTNGTIIQSFEVTQYMP